MRALLSLLLAIGGVALMLYGWVIELTPAEGFPTLEVIGLYAVLPVVLIGIGVAMTESKILKFFLTLVLVGAIALLGYTFLSLTL